MGQGRRDRGRGPEDVDHDGNPSRNGLRRHTMEEFVAVPVHVADPDVAIATGMHDENLRP
jgi:hypothetical protein